MTESDPLAVEPTQLDKLRRAAQQSAIDNLTDGLETAIAALPPTSDARREALLLLSRARTDLERAGRGEVAP